MAGATQPQVCEVVHAGFGEAKLARAHALAALFMLSYVMLLGIAMSVKFHFPDWLSETASLTWGRLRYAHTQGVFFGWLGNAFFAFLYYAVPRLAERPVTSCRLGWLLFVLWNGFLVLPGWVLVHTGISQPLEWGEFPLIIDSVAIAALLLACGQFVLPLLSGRLPELYVAGWYVLGALVFTLLAYPIGNFIPEILPGARGATFSGLWIHDAVGLYATPLALAIAYVVIPATTRQPIFSHFLSMIGFWLLFLVYPLNGTHHYVFSSIPMEAQQGAIVASVYQGIDVIIVVANLLLSLSGCGAIVAQEIPLRFVWCGVIAYLIVSLQGSLQALMPINRFVHFSDWVIGHAHLAMIGFASFIAIGGILFVWERLPGTRYNRFAANWSFWLLMSGLLLMVSSLTITGLIQGHLWDSDSPWLESVRASQIYWWVRTFSGITLLLGLVSLVFSLATGPRSESTWSQRSSEAETEAGHPPANVSVIEDTPGLAWLRQAYVITAVAGVGCFAFSFVILGIWPSQVLEREIEATTPTGTGSFSASEARGRRIFIREGCVNCHSQLVRSTEADVRRFGVPSQAWESASDLPQLWGTRRVGPDLARMHSRRSHDWHLAHLWNPRHVVPESNMPAYPWLFHGGPTEPTAEAIDLVAYLNALGRNAKLAVITQPQPLPGMDPEEERRRGMFCDCAIPRTPGPAVLLNTKMEASERERFARRGAELFRRHCSGCHGIAGQGDGPASPALLPRPADLTSATYSDRALSEILWHGIRGSSMHGWHELSVSDLRALAIFVQSLSKIDATIADRLTEEERGRATHLYSQNCAPCHGLDGRGNDWSAGSLYPAPAQFHLRQPSQARAERALAEGVPGTTMASWRDRLSEAERRLLARYIREFYQPE